MRRVIRIRGGNANRGRLNTVAENTVPNVANFPVAEGLLEFLEKSKAALEFSGWVGVEAFGAVESGGVLHVA